MSDEGRYYCPVSNCKEDEYVAMCFGGDEDEPDMEMGVLVDTQGNATNRWEDGTIGVPEHILAWIQMDDCPPFCLEHQRDTEWAEGGE